MSFKCACCEKSNDTRMGVCFDCAECESLIAEGLDMRDKSPVILEGMEPYSKHLNILKTILKKYKVVKK